MARKEDVMTFKEALRTWTSRFSDVEQSVLRLKSANPDGDFLSALEALKGAEVVLGQFNNSRNDNEIVGWNLERAFQLAQETATAACRERFQREGRKLFLPKEVRRLVAIHADDVLRAEGHGMARTFLLQALREMRTSGGSREKAERRLKALVEPPPPIAITTRLTAPVAAVAAAHARG